MGCFSLKPRKACTTQMIQEALQASISSLLAYAASFSRPEDMSSSNDELSFVYHLSKADAEC